MIHEMNNRAAETNMQDGFGMDVSVAENVATWCEQTHHNAYESLGQRASFVMGLVGILATGWLLYHLVIQAIPGLHFNVGTFHRPQRPTVLSVQADKLYWALHDLPKSVRWRTSLNQPPASIRPVLTAFTQTVNSSQDAGWKRYISQPHRLESLYRYLRRYLQARPPYASNYMTFFAKNFFRRDALHMDMALFLVRSLFLGVLLLFSVRLFFDNPAWIEEKP